MKKLLLLERKMFHPHRFLIMHKLIGDGHVTFPDMKKYLDNISDGNLASHFRGLYDAGLIGTIKSPKKPKTIYYLTSRGKKQFFMLHEELRKYIGR